MRVAAIGGYQAKVALVEVKGELRLDGTVRHSERWRPVAVGLPDDVIEAFNDRMQRLEPQESYLKRMLRERLGG